MLRILAVIVVVAGCGDSDLEPTAPELHELGACAADWTSNGLQCERPCEHVRTPPQAGKPKVCTATYASTAGDTRTAQCDEPSAFDYRGVTGCCVYDARLDNGRVPVRFAVCGEE